MKLYAFKDVKVGFMEPFQQISEDVAKRSFVTAILESKTFIGDYKADLELWQIGEYDETTGRILSEIKYVMGGKDITT